MVVMIIVFNQAAFSSINERVAKSSKNDSANNRLPALYTVMLQLGSFYEGEYGNCRTLQDYTVLLAPSFRLSNLASQYDRGLCIVVKRQGSGYQTDGDASFY
jgi:hypothetical protein